MYTKQDILDYVEEQNVNFIRLAYFDVFGKQKNVSILPQMLMRAFEEGISFDASAIDGFHQDVRSDLFLVPCPNTMSILPWRSLDGSVLRMYCDIQHPDGSPFLLDGRYLLKKEMEKVDEEGYQIEIGSEFEFYLFLADDNGKNSYVPLDDAGYMDIAPEDGGEDVRKNICLTLEEMGILPEASHHEEGPGQNEIDFRYSDPLTAADNAVTFRAVVQTIAARSGLWADFSPKPLTGAPGSGLHINLSVHSGTGAEPMSAVIAGLLEHAYDMTAFLNPCPESYLRLGSSKAPGYITWSSQNRSQLIRVPAAEGEYRRVELRSPDPTANPYIAFALLIYAGLDGIRRNRLLPPSADFNLYEASPELLATFRRLPISLDEAREAAAASGFIREHLPSVILSAYSKA